jgi:hypothetical protein
MASYAITWRKSTKKDLRKIRPDEVPGIIEAVVGQESEGAGRRA